jgi:hypothetical protein
VPSTPQQIKLVGPSSGGVRLIEMKKNVLDHWVSTGRSLVLPPDSPVLEGLGPEGGPEGARARAVRDGLAALPSELFNVVVQAIEDVTGEPLSFQQ